MARKRLKKGFRNILTALLFSGISIFLLLYFDLWDKVSSFFNHETININIGYIFKPEVRIVNLDSDSRPIGVSINNNQDSWPHAGLQDAYLCYELIAEGGITRILAFFKDQNTAKIGSVRSTRHYFLDYVLENDAIFVHYGHSPQALSDISTFGINNINGMFYSKSFFRDKSLNRAYEHTAFTSMEKINLGIENYKYRKTSNEMLLNYSPLKVDLSENTSLKKANTVSIEYSSYTTTKYVYDSEKMVYKQFMDGKEQIDAVTSKQYTVKNIITYQVKNSALDSKGRQELYNTGNGEGYYISNGESIKIKWKKDSRKSKTIYTDMNGNELKVNDGNTWIHISPSGKKTTISE